VFIGACLSATARRSGGTGCPLLGGHFQHIRVEITEAGGEQQGRAVQLDHALHGFVHVVGLGDFFFLDDLHAGHLLQHRDGFGMCLIVSIVVFRPDIDESDHQFLRGLRFVPGQTDGGEAGRALQQAAA
jgi:hypothetical protein